MTYPQQPWQRWPHDRSFRPQGRAPVRGGRWSVRRQPKWWRDTQNRPWRAWTQGTARHWNRGFATHAEAVAWAQYVARLYAEHGPERADEILKAERKARHERLLQKAV